MKNIIAILALLSISALSFGQTAAIRGSNGNYMPYTKTKMWTTNYTGVLKNFGKDTLSSAATPDTGYTWVFVGVGASLAFDLTTSVLTGTVATTSNILYGYNNGGVALTAAQAYSIGATPTNAYAITGNTTYCSGCVGASSTTVPGAAKVYKWQVPNNAGALFDNYILRTIQTGTATATYTGVLSSQY